MVQYQQSIVTGGSAGHHPCDPVFRDLAPVAQAPTEPPMHATETPDKPTVLLVEDSPTQRRLVHTVLQEAGDWQIAHAVDGIDALQQLADSLPTVVLTDLFMPRMDGLQLVEQIRTRFPYVPVVLMTAQGSEQIAVDALRAGAADYVPKRALAGAVGAILDRAIANARAETDKLRLLSGMTGRSTRFTIANDTRLVPPLVAHLKEDVLALGVCDPTGAMRVAIALEEALLNAIYHGNLEVSSDLKLESETLFQQTVEQRREVSPYRDRRVRVFARVNPDRATFLVADQGPGFDPARIPDPTDPAHLDRPSGRGLLLMQTFMDEVRYNATGNQVRLLKRREGRP